MNKRGGSPSVTRPPPSRNDASDASERADAVGTIPGRLAALLNLLETVGAVRLRSNVEPVGGGPSPQDRRTALFCRPVGDRHLAVPVEHEADFRKAVRALGYVLPPGT
ncbi:MAG: hypothetical protein ACJ72W_19130 [Actinoallomurus sp.]